MLYFVRSICSALLIIFLCGCTLPVHQYMYDGEARKYLLYAPENLPDGAPLVFMLHGYHGKASLYSRFTAFNRVADEMGFAVCYPQGLKDEEGVSHWNARLDISEVDDIGFLSELAQHLQAKHGFDKDKTFTSGISNGGFMSYTLACEAPEIFSGAASIIGTMSGKSWDDCQTKGVPILQISGVEDKVVPIDGTMSEDGGWGGAPHMDKVIAFWASTNGCQSSTSSTIASKTTALYYSDCEQNNKVWYYKVSDLGHNLPSQKNSGFRAEEVVGAFFMGISKD